MMARQPGASVAFSTSSTHHYTPLQRGVQAYCCSSLFLASSSSSSVLRLASSARLASAGTRGSRSVTHSSGWSDGLFRSSFWSSSAFSWEAWVAGPGDGRKPKRSSRGCGVARAAGTAKGMKRSASGGIKPTKPGEFLLIIIAVAWMTIIVFIPFLNVFYQAFSYGYGPFIKNIMDPAFLHAVKMTCIIAGIVVPINTVFGLIMAIWITRREFPFKVGDVRHLSKFKPAGASFIISGRRVCHSSAPLKSVAASLRNVWIKCLRSPLMQTLLLSVLDLPFSISPVVVGLMLMLLYGRQGVFAPFLQAWNIEIVFALPGMILATCFVTLPFVVREVIPVMLEVDPFEEEAARTMGASDWEVFTQVTFPNIRLGLLYGVTLCNARAMGEFGAVSVVSGNIVGKTQTLTLFVEAAYKEYNTQGAFSAALLLSVLALFTLVIKSKLEDERAKQLSIR